MVLVSLRRKEGFKDLKKNPFFRFSLIILLAIILIIIVGVLNNNWSRLLYGKSAKAKNLVIRSLVTDKSRYSPGQSVKVTTIITNTSNEDIKQITMTANYYHLNQSVGHKIMKIAHLKGKGSKTLTWKWEPPNKDYQGYLISVELNHPILHVNHVMRTAVDVSSTWSKFPRYGFISDYPKQSVGRSEHEIKQLNTYHIDGIQFYDWQWKQHDPLAGTPSSPASSWHDIANRTNERQTIMDLIHSAHNHEMIAMNYNLLYGAWDGYGQDSSGVNYKWGVYKSPDGQNQASYGLPNGWNAQQIFVFNPGNKSWQHYIIQREADVFKAYPFDGWQVDQLGDLGILYDWKGNPVDLPSTFVSFLNKAKKVLHKKLIFNNVGDYGLMSTAPLPSENPIYIEAWETSGQSTYSDLKDLIDRAKNESNNKKSVILAAYMDSNYGNKFSSKDQGRFNTPGVLLTDAVIFASGGDHIELGDGENMLNSPYFPNHNLVMGTALKSQLKHYYDFMVAYENLLRGSLSNSTKEVQLKGIKTSKTGEAGAVWSFTKSGLNYDTIQLINMLGQKFSAWRDSNATYKTPPVKKNIKIIYYYGSTQIKNVFLASPDFNDGQSVQLTYKKGTDKKGKYISFKLHSLKYWDMVYVQKS